jgi:hypothetical protein
LIRERRAPDARVVPKSKSRSRATSGTRTFSTRSGTPNGGTARCGAICGGANCSGGGGAKGGDQGKCERVSVSQALERIRRVAKRFAVTHPRHEPYSHFFQWAQAAVDLGRKLSSPIAPEPQPMQKAFEGHERNATTSPVLARLLCCRNKLASWLARLVLGGSAFGLYDTSVSRWWQASQMLRLFTA